MLESSDISVSSHAIRRFQERFGSVVTRDEILAMIRESVFLRRTHVQRILLFAKMEKQDGDLYLHHHSKGVVFILAKEGMFKFVVVTVLRFDSIGRYQSEATVSFFKLTPEQQSAIIASVKVPA